MTTAERIVKLAFLLAMFPEMEGWKAAALCELVKEELGAVDALENRLGNQYLVAPEVILHVISANTPMAGIQSLVRGLILGSRNLCKIPQNGLSRFEEFVAGLPLEMSGLVEVSPQIRPGWLEGAEAVVVFGTDATVESFQQRVRRDQIFIGYGNRWSGAVVFEDPSFESIPLLTRDIVLYDQMGCLSPQIVWLHNSINVQEFGERLAQSLAHVCSTETIRPLAAEDEAAISSWRLAAEWQAAQSGGAVWLSDNGPVWGVALLEGGDVPRLSCLNRHVSLVPFSEKPAMGALSTSISSIGIWPRSTLKRAFPPFSEASRICLVGRMQFPSPSWKQDGFPALGRLVRRVGVEG